MTTLKSQPKPFFFSFSDAIASLSCILTTIFFCTCCPFSACILILKNIIQWNVWYLTIHKNHCVAYPKYAARETYERLSFSNHGNIVCICMQLWGFSLFCQKLYVMLVSTGCIHTNMFWFYDACFVFTEHPNYSGILEALFLELNSKMASTKQLETMGTRLNHK